MLYLYKILEHIVSLLVITSGILGGAVVLHAICGKNAAVRQDAVYEEKSKEDTVYENQKQK